MKLGFLQGADPVFIAPYSREITGLRGAGERAGPGDALLHAHEAGLRALVDDGQVALDAVGADHATELTILGGCHRA